jgi:3D (Asp-Asp-Asp) domain-containing protein
VVQKRFWTWDANWRSALRQAGVRVNRHDVLSLGLFASPTEPLVIRRAIPVEVVTPHHRYRTWTTAYRVKDVLSRLHIALAPLDVVKPRLDALIRRPTIINVLRRWYVTREMTSAVPFSTVYVPDANMYVGNRSILTRGADGKRVVMTRVLMQDGKPIRTTVALTRMLQPVVNRLVAVGTDNTVSRGGQVIQFTREITVVATAYWPNPAWSNGYTATGMRAQYGVVAVDPQVIPLGTHLYIPGYGFAVAADTGGAIVGDRIDLCFNSESAALNWGRQTVQVFVVR